MVEKTEGAIMDRAHAIHQNTAVIDAMGGSAFAFVDILEGGIHVTNVTLNQYPCEGFDHVLNQLRRYYRLFEIYPDKLMLVEKTQDIRKAKEQGRLGVIFGFQNGNVLGNDVTLLPIFYKLGVRIVQLTYNEANLLGCGCLEPKDTGLTAAGAKMIRAMNRLGILVDLSHVGHQTSRDAVEVSDGPVAITHGNPLALKKVPRNRPDDLIRMIAQKGGVIGLTPYAAFCKSPAGKRPTLNDFLDQIDYVVNIAGIDYVGIGTDKFEGKNKIDFIIEDQARYPKLLTTPFEHRHVEGFSHISQFPRITEGLLARGYSDEDCMKIIGGNFFSLFKRVWKENAF